MIDITTEPKIREGAIEITTRGIEITAPNIEITARSIDIGRVDTSFVTSGIDFLGRGCEIGRSAARPDVPGR